MRICPICRAQPRWHYCANVTWKTNAEETNHNKWVRYFLWSPECAHLREFGKDLGLIVEKDQKPIEERWDARAEAIFAEYTVRWTDPQKISFRSRIWPKPPPPSELFDRNNNEAPTA